MNGVNYLIGGSALSNQPLPIYSSEAIEFLSLLSSKLMRMPESRTYPDVMSVAYWCRKANLLKLKSEYTGADQRLGKGLAFHITPSNIPVNFAFSYFFSLLAGNANIVRVPSKAFAQTRIICSAIAEVIAEFPEIQRRTAFVSYPINDAITATFCKLADLRLIWGGDATIYDIRRHPAKPRCLDIVFADRYSICLIDGKAVLNSDEKELTHLAGKFYNDTYLMDQNACSSPQLIFWTNDSSTAREKFWNAVLLETTERYELQAMTAVDKYTHLCEDAIDHREVTQVCRQEGNLLYRAQLYTLPEDKTCLRGKSGYFYEYGLKSLDEICALVDEKYQTLTYYGQDAKALQQLVIQNRLRGIDRIVPIGSAMEIGIVWDGYDLTTMLSRVVQAI